MPRLYVHGVSETWGQNELQQIFGKYGKVVNIQTGQAGYAFVDMDTEAECEEAIHNLDGTTIEEHRIKVEPARGERSGKERAKHFGTEFRCYNCNKVGHLARDCKEKPRNPLYADTKGTRVNEPNGRPRYHPYDRRPRDPRDSRESRDNRDSRDRDRYNGHSSEYRRYDVSPSRGYYLSDRERDRFGRYSPERERRGPPPYDYPSPYDSRDPYRGDFPERPMYRYDRDRRGPPPMYDPRERRGPPPPEYYRRSPEFSRELSRSNPMYDLTSSGPVSPNRMKANEEYGIPAQMAPGLVNPPSGYTPRQERDRFYPGLDESELNLRSSRNRTPDKYSKSRGLLHLSELSFPNRDSRDPREIRDPRDPRDPLGRDLRDPRDIRDPRDPRGPRDIRDPRDPREIEYYNRRKDQDQLEQEASFVMKRSLNPPEGHISHPGDQPLTPP